MVRIKHMVIFVPTQAYTYPWDHINIQQDTLSLKTTYNHKYTDTTFDFHPTLHNIISCDAFCLGNMIFC